MPPKKRFQKKALQLGCEWASCQESFSQMENFCKHVESHLSSLSPEEGEEAEGEFITARCGREVKRLVNAPFLFLSRGEELPLERLWFLLC